MAKRKKIKRQTPEAPEEELVQEESRGGKRPPASEESDADAAAPDSSMEQGAEARGGVGLVEPPEEAVQRLTGELEEARDRYLRTAAEFDNFRKRTSREHTELWSRAQAQLVNNVLDALDDLGRVLELDPDDATAQDVISGVELVERKLMRELEGAGLARVGREGEPFDPNNHEAVSTVPAPSAEQDGTVVDVLQQGYRFGGALLRPARVRVYITDESRSGGEEAET